MSKKSNLKIVENGHNPDEPGHQCMNCDLAAFMLSIEKKYGEDIATVHFQVFVHAGATIARHLGPETVESLVDGIMSIDSHFSASKRTAGMN